MVQSITKSRFSAKLLQPLTPDSDNSWAFLILPKYVSDKLPRRGRTTVEGTVNGHRFHQTLEPDGQLSHWLRVSNKLMEATNACIGDEVELEIMPVEREPEPDIPADFQRALKAAPEAREVWDDATTIARVDWIHWIVSAKQVKTRAKRIRDACEMLSSGKRRVCCFDPSGFYSKALTAPKVVS